MRREGWEGMNGKAGMGWDEWEGMNGNAGMGMRREGWEGRGTGWEGNMIYENY